MFWFSIFNRFQSKGIERELQTVFMKNGGFFIALGHHGCLAARDVLKGMAARGLLLVERVQTTTGFQVNNLKRSLPAFINEGQHQVRTTAKVHVDLVHNTQRTRLRLMIAC